ncbi:MAG TPA: DUF6268 family outer membrane beta-barrel protein [Chthoniobacterales bacterium]|jgi:hypothetical protein
MKPTYAFALITAALSSLSWAGSVQVNSGKEIAPTTPEVRPRVEVNFRASTDYVGSGDFRFRGAGEQDAFHAHIEAGVSIPLKDAVYFTFNGFYDRFDFGTSLAPVPTTLYKVGADVALEYRSEGEVAVALIASPGIYGSEIHSDSFNVPITAYGSYRLTPSLVVVAGARYNQWSEYPILPSLGLIWTVNEHWKVRAIASSPRIEYSPNEDVTFSVGGELGGGTYRTAKTEQNFGGEKLDYYDIRAGAAVTYRGWKPVSLSFSAGWSFERSFTYDELDEKYGVEGAPYVAVAAKATF